MSVQLIVYPQNYNGAYNEISTSSTEFIVNGLNFNGLDITPTYTSSTTGDVVLDVLTSAPPIIINSWYRFRTDTSGTPDYPLSSAGSLILDSVSTLTLSGVYQKLSNLVIGQQYTITINLVTTGTGQIFTKLANGTLVYVGSLTSASSSQITETFTAQSTGDTVIISYFNNVVDSIKIGDISVQPVVGAVPSGAVQLLEDGQVICDLYEDEDLPLTLSVDDFKNVAEKVQSYSKAFNLPATKRNNKIFNAIFEITRSYDGIIFNPYKKTKCVLKQDGFILFEGFLRMLDVTDKMGEISYNVNLYSEVIALADTLKDRTFRDLDFLELEHSYNRTEIINSWNDAGTGIAYTNASTSGFRDDNSTVKYPFVDWSSSIEISDGYGTNATENNPELTSLEQVFRPFINIKYLIDRIFNAPNTPFTYSSDFFNAEEFKELYMDFNWGSDNTPVEIDITTFQSWYIPSYTTSGSLNYATTTYTVLELSPPPIPFIGGFTPPNYDNTTEVITSTILNEAYDINYAYKIENIDTVDRTIECQWLYNSTPINYSGVQTIAANGGTYDYTGNFSQIMFNAGDTLQVQFRTNTGTASKVRQADCTGLICNTANVVFNVGAEAITSNTILQTLRGELGQWDFLKGLITMFNLVTLVDEDNPNNIIIEPYAEVFIPTGTAGTTLADRGIQHDWTDKIDVSEMKLTPLSDLNKKTIFKFVEDDDDFAFNNYKNLVGGHLYGSKKYNAGNEFNILDGEDEIIAEPFAATVIKPLWDNLSQFITPAIYSYDLETDTSESFENSPRILYNNGIKSTGASYYIPEKNGVSSSNETDFLQFSHLSTVPSVESTSDFNFGECQLIGAGSATVNNLFNTYWLPYYSELYNPNTRTMTIKVNLSPSDINTFKFNDTCYIKNRVFRVNKIDYKPNDLATVEFILIP